MRYVKDLVGLHNVLVHATVGAVAVKEGDPIKVGASQDVVIPVTAAADAILGVASHAAAVGDDVLYYPATPTAVFEVTTVTTGYAEATHKWNTCDLAAFTSGAMTANPGADVSHQLLMLGLEDGETSGSAGNKMLVKINQRAGQGA